ncbi:MAG: O-antigen ligase family protein [Weeksellaceae bacterium]|nr:O-antigen ligase family protein [Weeksellaceae bacterium]
MSFHDMDVKELLGARVLPAAVGSGASMVRWGLFGILLLYSLYMLQQKKLSISQPVSLLVIFYFLQFLYALVDGVDYLRFLALTGFCLLLPPIIGKVFQQNNNILKYFVNAILLFLIISVVLNGHLILAGQRFFGFMSNSNAYGIATIFWLVIIMLANRNKLIHRYYFNVLLLLILATAFFSGSRNAVVGCVLILGFNYIAEIGKFAKLAVFSIISAIILSYFIDLSFLLSRFSDIADAASSSGRQDIWDSAAFMIDKNLWWGNGMDAHLLITGYGNMHNCYIRFVLNMGLFFTILVVLTYFLSILSVFLSKRAVPLILPGYLLVYAVMNVGEDFFVGLGSVAFIYMLFILGFINYYITRPPSVNQS